MTLPEMKTEKLVFIVTGASRGYGHAIVEELFKFGPCHVLGTARNEQELLSLQTTFGSTQFQYVAGDITDPLVMESIVQKAIQVWGRIDGIVQNAGVIEPMGPITMLDIDSIKKLFDVNLFSVIQLTQLALPYLRERQGKVICISSGAANKAYPSWAPYCMSKTALNMFVDCLAQEEPKIITLAFRPGVLNTPMQTLIREKGEPLLPKSMYDFFTKKYNNGELVNPSISARIVAHFCFNANQAMSGKYLKWEDEEFNVWRNGN